MPGGVARARESYLTHAWKESYDGFLAIRDELSADDLERLAVSAYLVGRNAESDQARGLAYRRRQDEGDPGGAIRCVFWVAFRLVNVGERMVANVWIARLQRLAAATPDGSLANAQLDYLTGLRAAFEGEVVAAATDLERSAATATHHADEELAALPDCPWAAFGSSDIARSNASAAQDELHRLAAAVREVSSSRLQVRPPARGSRPGSRRQSDSFSMVVEVSSKSSVNDDLHAGRSREIVSQVSSRSMSSYWWMMKLRFATANAHSTPSGASIQSRDSRLAASPSYIISESRLLEQVVGKVSLVAAPDDLLDTFEPAWICSSSLAALRLITAALPRGGCRHRVSTSCRRRTRGRLRVRGPARGVA